MATNDASTNDHPPADREPEPELIDWWVWGVRKVAAVIAELLLTARSLIALFVAIKLLSWALTQSTNELYQAGAGVAGFVAAWAIAIMFRRFAWTRDSPDPERWLAQRRRW